MRLKPGRPDLADYARFFDSPPATTDSAVRVTWAGVTTLLIDDGTSAVLTDGCLARLGVDRLDAVLPVHTHYDHAMDSAVVAERTGARLVVRPPDRPSRSDHRTRGATGRGFGRHVR